MSTTNPERGDATASLTSKPASAPSADDHDRSGPPDPSVIQRGYELDSYDTKSVMSVPILVIVFFVLAFVTVTILFRFLRVSPDQPNANPLAVQDNSRPLNDRMGDIHLGGKVDQPRLETLRLRSGDARAITRPELPTGNSPELHADQLHPSPENTPALYESGWLDPNKTVAHITIDDAMKAALAPASKLFPAQKDGTGPAQSTNIPTAANAGRGRAESTATPPNPKDPVHQEKDEKKEGKKEGKH